MEGEIRRKSALWIEKSFLTLAVQAAPGDGITLRDCSVQIFNASDVVVGYLGLRPGDEVPGEAAGVDDTLVTNRVRRVIIDHCSLSWAIDGTHDVRRGGDFTLQWSIVGEAPDHRLHHRWAYAMAASCRDLSGPITLRHSLIATGRDLHPSFGTGPAGYTGLEDCLASLVAGRHMEAG